MKYLLVISALILFSSTCYALDIDNVTILSEDYTENGSAFVFIANDSALDCNGFSIIGNGSGIAINATGLHNITIRDCEIYNFSIGISLNDTNATILNNTIRNIFFRQKSVTV